MARSSQASAVFTHTQLGFYAVAAFGLLYVYSDSAQVRWWAQAEVESRAASIAPHAARPPHRRIPATTTPPHACRRSLSACTSPRNGGTCMVRGKCSRRAGAACWQRRARAGSERAHTFRGSAAPAPSSPPCPPLLPHLQAPCACRPTCTCAHSFARSWGRPTGRSQCSARQGGGSTRGPGSADSNARLLRIGARCCVPTPPWQRHAGAAANPWPPSPLHCRGYVNFYTLFIVWLCSAVFFHLPSFTALGIDIRADVSLSLSVFFSSMAVRGDAGRPRPQAPSTPPPARLPASDAGSHGRGPRRTQPQRAPAGPPRSTPLL